MLNIATDSSFNPKKTKDYTLSIQVSLDGFSFLIFSPEENRIAGFSNHPVKISNEILLTRHFKEWIYSDDIFQKNFRKITLLVFSHEFSLVPEKYSTQEIKDQIPLLLFEKNEKPELAENYLENIKSKLLFTLPAGLNELVQNFFGQTEILHPVKVIASQLPETQKKFSLIIFSDSYGFYCILTEAVQIRLTNYFKILHASDAVYFVMNMIKQFTINPSEVHIFFAEQVKENQPIMEALQPFFENTGQFQDKSEIGNRKLAEGSFLNYLHNQ